VSSEQFSYIWEYTVDPARKAEFLSAYEPDGDWAQLMSRHPGYLGTKLLGDVEIENRYVTVDYWASKSDRDAFRAEFSTEFDELDQECEQLTLSETFLGDFFILGG
jgi:heme-degrading monooxygenase HmoA